MHFSAKTLGLASAVVTVLIWTMFIVIARGSASHTLLPMDIVLLRLIGAGVLLFPWALWQARKARASGRFTGSLGGLSPLPLRITLVAGLFGSLLYGMLAYTGFFYAPASHASVLMPGSLPLWTSLLAWWWLSEAVPRARLVGLLCIVAGDLLVGGASLLKAFEGGDVWRGDLLFMSASFVWSVYALIVRRHALDAVQATMAVTAMGLPVFAALFVLCTSAGLWDTHLWIAPWQESLFQAAFQGGASVVISGITFMQMVRYFGPVRSTLMTALVPGLSALGALVFLGEPLFWNQWLGLALVTSGIVLGVRQVAGPGKAA